MPTFRQLGQKGRVRKTRRCVVAALKGAPHRKAVVIKMGITTPKKPNSAKRKYAKVRVLASRKLVFAHPPGQGSSYLQEYSIVMIEGGNPPDVPGINYTLVRGLYDFSTSEEFGRRRKRSKYGATFPNWLFVAPKSLRDKIELPKSLIPVYEKRYKLNVPKKKFKLVDKNVAGGKKNVLNEFSQKDFSIFIKKFCGVFIYRGKKSYAINAFNYFLKEMKKKFNNDPMKIFYTITKNLVPFFLLTQKKFGKRLVYLPIIAKANKKNRFMLNWLVRQLRNKSNIKGVKKEDVLNLLFETFKKRGSAMNLKKEFYNVAMSTKYNLRRNESLDKYLKEWEWKKLKKEEEEQERYYLLQFLTMEGIKLYRKKRAHRRMLYIYNRMFFKKRKRSYKKILVK